MSAGLLHGTPFAASANRKVFEVPSVISWSLRLPLSGQSVPGLVKYWKKVVVPPGPASREMWVYGGGIGLRNCWLRGLSQGRVLSNALNTLFCSMKGRSDTRQLRSTASGPCGGFRALGVANVLNVSW